MSQPPAKTDKSILIARILAVASAGIFMCANLQAERLSSDSATYLSLPTAAISNTITSQEPIVVNMSPDVDFLANDTPFVETALSNGQEIITFKMGDSENASPLADSEWKTSIEQAIDSIESEGYWCSFSMISVDDGACIQYGQNIEGYSASCAKAIFCFYILTHAEEPLDDYMLENMEYAIVYSDNDAYDAISASQYYNEDYIEWLSGYGINSDIYSELGNYFYISSPSLCAVWMDIAKYIDEGNPEALWFSNLLSAVEVSFIHNGTGDAANIRNKAGWIDDGLWDDYGLNATNDAGIVEINGKRYILAITTGMPVSYDAVEKVGHLACALLQLPYVGADYTSVEEEPAEESW